MCYASPLLAKLLLCLLSVHVLFSAKPLLCAVKTYEKTKIAAVSVKYHLQDMLDAFPNEDRVRDSNMRQFATAVAGLLHISDFQRRRITHMMRHYRDMRRRFAPAALSTTGIALLHLVMQFATPSLRSFATGTHHKSYAKKVCATARPLPLSPCLCCSSPGHIHAFIWM